MLKDAQSAFNPITTKLFPKVCSESLLKSVDNFDNKRKTYASKLKIVAKTLPRRKIFYSVGDGKSYEFDFMKLLSSSRIY